MNDTQHIINELHQEIATLETLIKINNSDDDMEYGIRTAYRIVIQRLQNLIHEYDRLP